MIKVYVGCTLQFLGGGGGKKGGNVGMLVWVGIQ
jgi:hypothetical protein